MAGRGKLAWLDGAGVAAVLMLATMAAGLLRRPGSTGLSLRWRLSQWVAILVAAFLPGFWLATFDLPVTMEVEDVVNWHPLIPVAGAGVALFAAGVLVLMLRQWQHYPVEPPPPLVPEYLLSLRMLLLPTLGLIVALAVILHVGAQSALQRIAGP